MSSEAGDPNSKPASKHPMRVIRIVMVIAAAAIFIGATILLLAAAGQMVRAVIVEIVGFPEISPDVLRVALIESVDIMLVSTVLYIIAIGLYELFVDSRMRPRLPRWLRTYDITDLEARLVGMVITVLAVIFMTQALEWHGDNILEFGLAIGAVIAAMSLFLYIERRHMAETAAEAAELEDAQSNNSSKE